MFKWASRRYGKKLIVYSCLSFINIIFILGIVWGAIISAILPFNSFENNTAIINLMVMYKINPFFYLTIFSTTITMINQMRITAPLFKEDKIHFYEFLLFVVMGGIAMPVIILIFTLLWNFSKIFDNKVKQNIKTFSKKYTSLIWGKKILYSVTCSLMFLPIPLTFIAQNPLDMMSPNYVVTLSLDPDKPNTILLFMDSLSAPDIEEYIGKEKEADIFDNFVSFDNTVTPGIGTSISFNSMVMGERWAWGISEESSTNAMRAKSEVYDWIGDEQNNKIFINPMSILGDEFKNDFTHKASGDWEYAEEVLGNDISVVNWSRAQKAAIDNGVRWKSHYYNNVQYPINNYEIGDPSTIFIYDESLHYPFLSGSTGNQTPFGTIESTFNGTFHGVNELFEGLKSISNDVTNAFDNSTIIITTDHASHHLDSPTKEDPGERFLGKAYMKFPNFDDNMSRITDNVLWTPHMRNIVEAYDGGRFVTQEEMVEWVESNNNFSLDRNSYVGIGTYTFHDNKSSAMLVTMGEDNTFEFSSVDWLENNIFDINDIESTYPGRVLEEVRWKD